MDYQENWGLIGQDWAVNLLKHHIASDHVRHAYLITGPSGTGRRTLALAFAQALNCRSSEDVAQPCGVCSTCKRIQSMQYPDLHIVQAEQVGGILKVDQIRELQHNLALAPYEARYRTALLLRFEEAHLSASNALLKTLEEPNPKVILMLTAENPDALLPTIVSRCEIIRLRPVPLDVLIPILGTRLGIPEEDARFLAHISSGRPGTAIQYMQNPELIDKRAEILDNLSHLLSANRVERFSFAADLTKDKDLTRITLQTWMIFWRDVLLKASAASTPVTNLDLEAKIDSLTAAVDRSTAFDMVQQIASTLSLLDQNVNIRLAVEVLLLNMPRLSEASLA